MVGGEHLDALGRAELRFIRQLLAERPDTRRAGGIAGHLANARSIGTRADGVVRYADIDFVRAMDLAKYLGAEPLPAPAPKPEAKRGAKLPSHVAVLPVGPWPASPFPFEFLSMTSAQLAKLPADVIIVCDEARHMRHIPSMAWLHAALGLRRAVAIYRGDAGPYRASAVDAVLCATKASIWFLADYQPRALVTAAEVPRLDWIALPAMRELLSTKTTMAGHQFTALLRRHASYLDAADSALIRECWRGMQDLSNGWRVEDYTTVRSPVRALAA